MSEENYYREERDQWRTLRVAIVALLVAIVVGAGSCTAYNVARVSSPYTSCEETCGHENVRSATQSRCECRR